MIFLFSIKKLKSIFKEENFFLHHPFRYYFKLHTLSVSISLISLVVTNFLFALPPLFIGQTIDKINENVSMNEILKTLFLFFLALIFLFISRYIWRIYWGGFRHLVAENLQKRIFNRWTQLGPKFYSKHSVGQLVSFINNDVSAFNMAIGPGTFILCDVILLLSFIGYFMVSISWEWTWKCLIFLPIIPFMTYFISRIIEKRYKISQDRFADMSGQSEEIISGIRIIKSYNLLKPQTESFDKLNRAFEEACVKVEKSDALFNPIVNFGISLSGLLLLIIASPDILGGSKSLGDFLAFFQYIQQLSWPLFGMSFGASLFKKGQASFQRLFNFFSVPVETFYKEKKEGKKEGKKEIKLLRKIEVKDLNFKFEGKERESLKNISFELNVGESLGIVGLVGSGKTTLLLLLLQYYSLNQNRIFLNGYALNEVSLNSIRSLITYVPQESFLFSDTILNNLFMGKTEKTKNEGLKNLNQFLKILSLEEEVQNFSKGLNMHLGEKGINLSGGQKQRLSILRALIQDPDVLILDDNFRATDRITAKKALYGIKELLKEKKKTLILASQRMSDFEEFDKLLVLNEDGTQESFGSLEEIKKNSIIYRKLSRLQTKNFQSKELKRMETH